MSCDDFFSLVACSRWEEADIVEWIAYHKSIGVDHIYLYSNDDTPDIQFKRVLPYILGDKPFVTYLFWPFVGQQLQMYLHFLDNFKTNTKWAMFLDIDEFLVIKPDNDICRFLRGFEGTAECIYFNWVGYGNNGRKVRDEDSILLTRTRRSSVVDVHTKVAFRTDRVSGDGARAGMAQGLGAFTHFWDGYPFENFRIVNVVGEHLIEYAKDFPQHAYEIVSRPDFIRGCLEKAYVAHFIFKSEADFVRRAERGGFVDQGLWRKVYDEQRHLEVLVRFNQVEDFYLRDYWQGKLEAGLRFVPAI